MKVTNRSTQVVPDNIIEGDKMQFALMETDGMMNSQCGLCGNHTDSLAFDVVMFDDGGPSTVCNDCCEHHAIELMYVRSKILEDLVPRETPKPDKQSLLDVYERHTVLRCIEFKGDYVGYGDEILIPDEDGDVVMRRDTWELRSTDDSVPVRVIVNDRAQCTDVVRLMPKLADVMIRQFSATDDLGNVGDPLESTTVLEAWTKRNRQEQQERLRQTLDELKRVASEQDNLPF